MGRAGEPLVERAVGGRIGVLAVAGETDGGPSRRWASVMRRTRITAWSASLSE